MDFIDVFGEKVNLDDETEAMKTKFLIEGIAYKTLMRIKSILEDDSLNDEACFFKIEEIVREFEKLGYGVNTGTIFNNKKTEQMLGLF